MHVHRYILAISKIDHTDPGLTVARMDKPILERTCPGCSCQLAIGLIRIVATDQISSTTR